MNTTQLRKKNMTDNLKLDPAQINPGDLMAFVYYAKVETITNSNEVNVFDLDNKRHMTISGRPLLENAMSADQFLQEQKVGKTQAAEILVSSPNCPISVCFTKADGSDRVLRGRLVKPEPLLGRSMMEDLDLDINDPAKRLRQVDHRTIKFIIVGGVKYIVK